MKKNKALFLDRDGVINVEKNYVYKIEDFEFIEGIFEFVKVFVLAGYKIVVVTNQAGIAREFYTVEDFELLTSWMKRCFLKHNIFIDRVYYCPHHPSYTGDCLCRKPNPGMFESAAEDLDLNMNDSVMIGDKVSDLIAAESAGIKKTYLFTSGDADHSNATRKTFSDYKDILNELF